MSLTASAERHVLKHGLAEAVAALGLGRDCMVDDIVSAAENGGTHHFAIIRRRWIAGPAGAVLELTLDHPARTAG